MADSPPASPPPARSAGPPPAAALAALAALRERFLASTENTLSAFRGFARQLAVSPAAPAVVEGLRRELHRVHGTAGTYGFTEASRLAARMGEQAVRWAAAPHLDVERRAVIVEHFVEALAAAFVPEADPVTPPRPAPAAALAAGVPVIALGAPTGVAATSDAVLLAAAPGAAELLAAAERLAVRASWAGATVLVVDDDPEVLAAAVVKPAS